MTKKWLKALLMKAVQELLTTLLTELLARLSTGDDGDKSNGELKKK